jgi:hypothetical protein
VKVPDQSFSLPEFPICLLFPTARPSSTGEKLVLYYPGNKEGHIPTRSASFDVALFGLFPEIGIGENGETLRNG